MPTTQFPADFKWGVSTAAAQIETASDHNWRGLKANDGAIFERTTDHEKRRAEDLEIIRQFGSVYRCGVDWARLQPSAMADFDQTVVEEYADFFQKINDAGMEIMFVFNHFTHPIWFEKKGNAWLSEDNIPLFLNFAEQCIEYFGKYVKSWNTFNEPNVFCLNAYITGDFPPHKKASFGKAHLALRNMGIAHDLLFAMLKKNDASKLVGISFNTCYFEGRNFLGKMMSKFTDWWFHEKSATFFAQNCDFWGLSYYAWIQFDPQPITQSGRPEKIAELGLPHDDMWAYYPEGLGKNVQRFYKKYKKPIFITENGICTEDSEKRIAAIKDYLTVLKATMDDGVPILGYIFWSAWDNFEWNLGNTFRFGLVRVDFKTMNRSMTSAGLFYSKVTQTGGF
jgi:beta-glucosidase